MDAELAGVLCPMDDILVIGRTREEHDQSLEALLGHGLTLNPDKCLFGVKELKYLGQVIDENGVRKDPRKTSAIIRAKSGRNN